MSTRSCLLPGAWSSALWLGSLGLVSACGAADPGDAGNTEIASVSGPCGQYLGGAAAASQWVYVAANGKLAYKPLNANGDRIMDFSYAGYMGGGVPLPTVPVVQTLHPSGSDDTA